MSRSSWLLPPAYLKRDYDPESPLKGIAFADTTYYDLSNTKDWPRRKVQKLDVFKDKTLKKLLPLQKHIPTIIQFLIDKRDDALLLRYFPAAMSYEYSSSYLENLDDKKECERILKALRDAFEDMQSKLRWYIVDSPFRSRPTIFFTPMLIQMFRRSSHYNTKQNISKGGFFEKFAYGGLVSVDVDKNRVPPRRRLVIKLDLNNAKDVPQHAMIPDKSVRDILSRLFDSSQKFSLESPFRFYQIVSILYSMRLRTLGYEYEQMCASAETHTLVITETSLRALPATISTSQNDSPSAFQSAKNTFSKIYTPKRTSAFRSLSATPPSPTAHRSRLIPSSLSSQSFLAKKSKPQPKFQQKQIFELGCGPEY
ncbi:hypothetical protein BT96DRAFT_916346 [Gymnopus androsaceus JB14]|uniref:Uncharacterized protein n=1 Tax=Gymnopus androsaceus JB14 TaxID=1447944 RepID=A0A6A4I0C7_9AGAR|nr:hypothetical protein BT96DRAFT_916346 [Gymnopus androsaceus JB14]